MDGTPFLAAVWYKNWRGETSLRRIELVREWYGSTEFHPNANQHLLDVWDFDKKARRNFAVDDIIGWQPITREELTLDLNPFLPAESLLILFRTWFERYSSYKNEIIQNRTS